jgi:chromosome segregation ATPase
MRSKKMAAIVIVVATFSLVTIASVFAGQQGKGRHKTKGSALLAKQGRGEYKSKFLHAQGRPFRYLQEKIHELEARLGAYEANAISLQDEIATVRQDILDIQTQISQIQTEILDIKALQENYDANPEQVEAIEAEVAYLQTELYEKIAELFQKIEQIENELQGQILILQAQNIQYGKTIEEGQTAIAQLQDDLSGAVAQLNGLRNDVGANSSLIAQLQIDCLNIQN